MIGFQTPTLRQAELESRHGSTTERQDSDSHPATAEEILAQRARLLMLQAIEVYWGGTDTVIIGDREQWLAQRLKKIKERYLAPL